MFHKFIFKKTYRENSILKKGNASTVVIGVLRILTASRLAFHGRIYSQFARWCV